MAFAGTDQTLADFLQIHGLCKRYFCTNEKIGYKIRKAQMEKVPYMAVIGEKEVANHTLSIRERSKGDLGAMAVEDVIAHIQELTATRKG